MTGQIIKVDTLHDNDDFVGELVVQT